MESPALLAVRAVLQLPYTETDVAEWLFFKKKPPSMMPARALTVWSCTNDGCPRSRFWDLGKHELVVQNYAVRELVYMYWRTALLIRPITIAPS
jgi:hypothetical protein